MCEENIFDMIRSEAVLTEQKYDIILIKAMVPFGHYTTIYEGMGCSSYVRNRRGKIEAIFHHNDDGYFPEKIKKIEEFIKRYKLTKTNLTHDWAV